MFFLFCLKIIDQPLELYQKLGINKYLVFKNNICYETTLISETKLSSKLDVGHMQMISIALRQKTKLFSSKWMLTSVGFLRRRYLEDCQRTIPKELNDTINKEII